MELGAGRVAVPGELGARGAGELGATVGAVGARAWGRQCWAGAPSGRRAERDRHVEMSGFYASDVATCSKHSQFFYHSLHMR